ncbi:MAG: flagellar assembly protein FliW [bacterium]
MKIVTKQFGELEFNDDIIIEFNEGIFGFEEYHKYILITEENALFYWLTNVEVPEIMFPLFSIRLLEDNYPQQEGYEAFGIVRMDKNPANITINMKAPVYISQNEKIGFQKILENEIYQINYKLFVEK